MTVTPHADLAGDEPVVAPGADGPRLVGARCGGCGTAWFPYRAVCPSCAAPGPGRLLLGPAGTLYSWSTVHISSSRPVPYTLGYVDMAEGVRVLATIKPARPLILNGSCRLVASPAGWWFEPEGDAA